MWKDFVSLSHISPDVGQSTGGERFSQWHKNYREIKSPTASKLKTSRITLQRCCCWRDQSAAYIVNSENLPDDARFVFELWHVEHHRSASCYDEKSTKLVERSRSRRVFMVWALSDLTHLGEIGYKVVHYQRNRARNVRKKKNYCSQLILRRDLKSKRFSLHGNFRNAILCNVVSVRHQFRAMSIHVV